ncbi:MAG: hypothetical protein FWC39_13240 [Bacteroidetes bacterium]|nr:hypothetical protein [Bacteroidota bacterium]MCL2329460.1 hypothetical protein [Bacteroidota bacterium]
MKKVFYLFILSLFLFSGCDYWASYTFKVKNSTQETITLKFEREPSSYDTKNKKEVVLLPAEEKVIRVIDGSLNDWAHDCLTMHGIGYFNELVFDTYVNDEKLEKQLWQAENWTYQKKSKSAAEYTMTITNEMIE